MSVEKMKLATINGNVQYLDSVLEACVESENFQIENAAEFMSALKGFERVNDENAYANAVEMLRDFADSFDFDLEYCKNDDSQNDVEHYIEQVDELVGKLKGISDEKEQLENQIMNCETAIKQFEHFDDLDIPINDFFRCEYVDVRFGRLPTDNYNVLAGFCEKLNIIFYPFSVERDYCWGMYIVAGREEAEADRIFASLFFERMQLPESTKTPHETVEMLKEQLEQCKSRLKDIENKKEEVISGDREYIQRMYSALLKKSRICEFHKFAVQNEEQFVLVGFVPQGKTEDFSKTIGGLETVSVAFSDTKNARHFVTPTKLKNNRLVRPFEFYIRMFGVPKYGEMDPTAFVAITYTILYGIMFADLGQGIILSIVGYLMYRIKKMDLGRLLIPCGISGAFFGLVFGSVFGFEEALNPIYKTVFGLNDKPIRVMDSANMLYILFSAVGIGMVLVLVAMILNIYSCFKQKNIGGALFGTNGVCGFLVYSGILLIVLNLLLDLGISLMGVVIGMIVVPLLLIWMGEPLGNLVNGKKDWQPESWGEYLVQGIFELFESVISYLTNTVSFLRVGAFILVHASMMEVFFTLAEMTGEGGIFYYVLIVFGNVFVLALEGLLVGVQSLRLEFYEMFNRFFEGSGKEFEPIKY